MRGMHYHRISWHTTERQRQRVSARVVDELVDLIDLLLKAMVVAVYSLLCCTLSFAAQVTRFEYRKCKVNLRIFGQFYLNNLWPQLCTSDK